MAQWPGAGLPHLLRPVVDDVHQAVFLLGEMVTEMVRRDHENISEPRLIIFIDEVADLMEQGGKAMDRLMTRLTQRGRSAGIHIIACTQKPLAATIGSLTRSNFPVRLVGSVASPDDAKIAAGISGTGAEKLLGRGDFLLVAKSQVVRFQAAYASGKEIKEVTSELKERYGSGPGRRSCDRLKRRSPLPPPAPMAEARLLPRAGGDSRQTYCGISCELIKVGYYGGRSTANKLEIIMKRAILIIGVAFSITVGWCLALGPVPTRWQ